MAVDPLSERAAGPGSGRARKAAALAPVGLWLLIAALMALLADGVTIPRRYQDEFLYWGLAHSIADGHGLTWYGGPYPIVSSFYPLVMSLAVQLTDTVSAQFELIKHFNALLMSAVVFPVYVAARWFVAPSLALLAALMAAIVPSMNFVGMIETEALAYPLAAAALVALVRAIGRPSIRATVTFACFFALAVFSRIQFVSLLPIALLAAPLAVLLGDAAERRPRLAALRSLWIFLALAFAAGVVYLVVRGNAASGIYYLVLHPIEIAWDEVAYWLRAFSADLYVLCAMIPAIATFALLAREARRRDPLVAALGAVALVASIVFVLQMTWFTAIGFESARERHIVYERYIFYLGPLFFVGFVVALKQASARAVAISTAIAVLVLAAFPTQAILVPISQDAFSQAFLGFQIDRYPALLAWSGVLLAGLALVTGGLLALSRSGDAERASARYARMLVVILPIFLMLITQLKAWSYQQIYADGVRSFSPKPLDWVSRATDRSVGAIVSEGTDRLAFFLTGFWNPNVERLYVSHRPPISSYLVTAPTCELRWTSAGRILPSAAPGCANVPTAWLLESPSLVMHLRSETQRVHPRRTPSSTLIDSDGPARIFSLLGGRNLKDGEVPHSIVLRSFAERPAHLRLRLEARKAPVSIRLAGGATYRLAAGRPQTLVLPVRIGDRLTRIQRLPGEGGLFARSVELREGDGPWRAVD